MRKASIILIVLALLAVCLAQPTDHSPVKVAGCVMSVNGTFKLLTHEQTYILKGHKSELFSYNGKLIEVTGAVSSSSHPGVPVVLTITKLKKLADTCY